MKTNQNGFALIVIVLAAIAVLVAGGVGVWYFNRDIKPGLAPVVSQSTDQPKSGEAATSSRTTQNSNQPDNQQPAGWEIYNNDKYGIRFSYPSTTDFKSLDWQSASELLARGTAKDMNEARDLAKKAFDPHYEGDQLYVTFGAYSLSVGVMSVGLDQMMKERVMLLTDDVDEAVSDTFVAGVRAKKITVIPKNKIIPFWEAHIAAVKNDLVYDFAYSGILGSEGKPIDEESFNKGVAMLEQIAATTVFTDNMNSEAVKKLIKSQKEEVQIE